MIEWIEKLPEPLLPLVGAAALWVAFNYAVLAERAIAKDQASVAVPHCLETIERHEASNRLRPSGIGRALGLPQLDQLERALIEQYRPESLTRAEREARCACAMRQAAMKLRWDYAIHTASFRVLSAQSAASLSDEASAILRSGVCGLLPKLNIGANR